MGRQRSLGVGFFLFALLLSCFAAFAAEPLPPEAKLTGDLPAVLDAAGSGDRIPVSFVLADQLEGDALRARAAALAGQAATASGAAGKAARRQATVRALREHAARTQAGLLAALRALEARGDATRVRPLWIGNVVGADLTPAAVRALAARPEVRRVNWNPKRDVFLGPRASAAPAPRPSLRARYGLSALAPAGADGPGIDAVECGVVTMRAPEVWNELGNTGEGSVIAVIDTGVCWTHPDIANQIWVNPGEDLNANGVVMDAADLNGVDDDGNGFIDDLIGWNFDYNTNQPTDENSHGSHCAGTVAGDGTGGSQSGMAPDAKIMVVRVGVNFSDEVDVWSAMQYAAANGADAISMSLGWPHGQNPDRPTWRTNCENTIDAGTAMVIAAGNEGWGAEPDNVRTPGDVPRVITVGATDCGDLAAGFSSRGPVTWQNVPPWNDWPYPPGLVKPDISAPGVDTLSHSVCSGYTYMSGTSMATPHVAGAVALIVAANPGLEHDDIKALLEETAVDLGEPGKDNTYGSGRVDAYAAVTNAANPDGRVAIRESAVGCASLLNLTLTDSDLANQGTATVRVTSGRETAGETATLTESRPGSGVFKGTIEVAPGEPVADGRIQVLAADTITATYIDASDGKGGFNVPKTDTAAADCVAPAISAIRTTDISDTTAVIRWSTDEPSDGRVRFGPAPPPGQDASGAAGVTEHAVTLTGLAACTVYFFEVASADALGNGTTDDNAHNWYRFETYGNFPDIGVAPCHAGQVRIERPVYPCGGSMLVSVTDLDLNRNRDAVETVAVRVSSTTEPGGEWVTLTEASVNSARFEGPATLSGDAPVAGDGRLQLADGDLITAAYADADDGLGQAAFPSFTSRADCSAASAVQVRVTWLSNTRAVIEWDTAEPTSSRVEYGPTAALGELEQGAALVTQHSVAISGFAECARVHFRVGGTDAYGNTVTVDAGGAPFALNTNRIPGVLFYDGFETDTGWVRGGEWEIGVPQGKGGGPGGSPDPTRAFSGTGVLGTDLTGRGANPGSYEPGVAAGAVSPYFTCNPCQHSTLIVRRWLNVEGTNDSARISLLTPGNNDTIWQNGAVFVHDSSWLEQRYDLSAYLDGKPAAQLRFSISANASNQQSGWNVDEVIIKDGSLPDYAVCGGCSGAPSFAGVEAVVDQAPCAAGGLTLSWQPAVAWGSGAAGLYNVYRGTTPDFVPGPANRIATGVAETTYTDATAPAGQPVWYVVRAENAESCGSGPQGGVEEQNVARVPGTETVDRPDPGLVDGSLRADPVNHAHVRLTWAAVPNAARYRVQRGQRADLADAALLGETAGTTFEDAGALTDLKTYFYRVTALGACD